MVIKGTLEHRDQKPAKGDREPQGPSGSSDSADLSTVSQSNGTQIMTGN